jgi:N-ethylmaleimide reductase
MKLLEPFDLGDLRLKNRVVMAPMTRSRADALGVVGELTARYYAQRATAGLIISEAMNISEDALGSPMTPGIWNEAQVGAWRRVTEAVHAAGGLIFSQLWHTGRAGHSLVRNGRLPVAPSALAITGQQHFTQQGPKDYEVPRELTTAEVRATIDDYEHAARNAKVAGFDGVELHAAFGYLPNQFLVDGANRRADEYGGSIENRARFTLEVMERLVGVWGKGRAGIRLSPTIAYNGMVDSDPLATFGYLVQKLGALPLAYLHMMRSPFPTDAFPQWPKDTVATFGPMFHGPVIANSGYTRDSGEQAVASGAAALVSYGALYVANPDLVRRFELGAPLNEGDRSTFYQGGAKGYVDYPALGEGSLNDVVGRVEKPVQHS